MSLHPHDHQRLRLHRAFGATSVVWVERLPNVSTAVALLKYMPLSQPFHAHIAAYNPNKSHTAPLISFPVLLQLSQGVLLIRFQKTLGLLALTRMRIIRPGILAIGNLLLNPNPDEFKAVSAQLSRACAIPSAPSFSRFKILKPLGADNFVKEYQVVDGITGESLVMKLYRRPLHDMKAMINHVTAVRSVLHQTRGHPFVLDLRHACQTRQGFALIVERCDKDLMTILRTQGPINEDECLKVVAQLVCGIERVHEVGGWLDLLGNRSIVVDANGWIRIAGIGGCKVKWNACEELHRIRTGKLTECELNIKRSREEDETRMGMDWWTLGVLTHYMLCGEFPIDEEQGEVRIAEDVGNEVVKGFLRGLLRKDKEERLGWRENEIRKHVWLRDVNWNELERRDGWGVRGMGRVEECSVLDLDEVEMRQTFSVQVVPEGIEMKERKRKRFRRVLRREKKEQEEDSRAEESIVGEKKQEKSDVLERSGIEIMDARDEMFVCGFGMTSLGPGFSDSVDFDGAL